MSYMSDMSPIYSL